MRPVDDLSSLAPGSHLCAFYRDEQELELTASAFVAGGLAAGAQVLYVAADRSPEQVSATLTDSGVAADAAIRADQLVVRDFATVYGAAADLATLAVGFRDASVAALNAGFTGLRVAAEMTDFVETLGSADGVLRWERMASRVQQETGIASVCQYDRRRIPEQQARALAEEHSGSAPLEDEPPQARFLATREPWGLRVVGEVDVANVDLFMAAVMARCLVEPRIVLDASELRFVDVDTIRRLVILAGSLRPEAHVSVIHPPPILERTIGLVFRHHPGLDLRS